MRINQISVIDAQTGLTHNFYPQTGQDVLDVFCNFLVREGIVDEIKYSRHFSLVKETTKALEGRQ